MTTKGDQRDAPARAWVLNLDAEHELEARHHYAPTLHMKAIVAREQRRLIGSLVGPRDIVIGESVATEKGVATGEGVATRQEVAAGEDDVAGDMRALHDENRAAGLIGIAWSPTPGALARLRSAGAHPIEAPSLAVLRAVNARPFATLVRAPLSESSFVKQVVSTFDDVLAMIALPARDGWLVRRTFGAAGRGRRRIEAGRPSPAERAWIEASLRLGPLVIEPWVRVTREYTRSGWVHRNGDVVISAPCFQETTAHGSWTRTERAGRGEVASDDDMRLEEAVAVAGAALARAGYFGPFGIDAFRHRAHDRDVEVLNPLSEINARFTMDWSTAMSASDHFVETLSQLDALAAPLAGATSASTGSSSPGTRSSG